MVDYGNPMPSALTLSPNAGEPGTGREIDRELLFSPVLRPPLPAARGRRDAGRRRI